MFNAGFIREGDHKHEQHGQDAEDGDDTDQGGVYGVEKFRSGRHLSFAPFRMVPAHLEQSMIRIYLLHDFVAAPYENKADHGLIQSDGHRLSRISDGAERTEHIRVDDVDGGIQQPVVLHDGIDHVEAAVHDFAQGQQGQDGYGRQHERYGDMTDKLPAARPVDPASLVITVVNSRNGCQIDDEVHSDVLPHRRGRKNPRPVLRRGVPVDGIDMEERQDAVQDAVVGRQQAVDNVADDDPGQKMRKQYRGLGHP